MSFCHWLFTKGQQTFVVMRSILHDVAVTLVNSLRSGIHTFLELPAVDPAAHRLEDAYYH